MSKEKKSNRTKNKGQTHPKILPSEDSSTNLYNLNKKLDQRNEEENTLANRVENLQHRKNLDSTAEHKLEKTFKDNRTHPEKERLLHKDVVTTSLKNTLTKALTLANPDQDEVLKEVLELTRNFQFTVETGAPPLPTSISSEDLFINRKSNETAYEFLGLQYGGWLKHFTPSLRANGLYQDQLRYLDPKLMKALRDQRKGLRGNDNQKIGLSEVIPPKKQRIDLILSKSTDNDIKMARQLANAPVYRSNEQEP